jgi:hypothetical protein
VIEDTSLDTLEHIARKFCARLIPLDNVKNIVILHGLRNFGIAGDFVANLGLRYNPIPNRASADTRA